MKHVQQYMTPALKHMSKNDSTTRLCNVLPFVIITKGKTMQSLALYHHIAKSWRVIGRVYGITFYTRILPMHQQSLLFVWLYHVDILMIYRVLIAYCGDIMLRDICVGCYLLQGVKKCSKYCSLKITLKGKSHISNSTRHFRHYNI